MLMPPRLLGLTLSSIVMAVMTYELRLMRSNAAGTALLRRPVMTLCMVLVLCWFARTWSLMLRPALFFARVC